MASDKDKSVGEPGLMESLIPFWGSGRESVNHFQHHNYVRGVLWGAMAVSDVFLIKTIAAGGLKLASKAGSTFFIKETEMLAEKTTGNMFLSKAGNALGDAKIMVQHITEGHWRFFSNRAKFFMDAKRGYRIGKKIDSSLVRKLWKIVWDDRKYKAVSSQYWRISGGAKNGNSLQHLFFPQNAKWVPQGLRNAGFNLMEVPKALNSWMGGIPARERLFRAGVISILVHTASISSFLTDKTIDFMIDEYCESTLLKDENFKKPPQKIKKAQPVSKTENGLSE